MKSSKLRIEITPSRGFVLFRKTNGEWQEYYSIGGPIQKRCRICGYPLAENQNCNHHKGLEKLKFDYSVYFVGYYETNFNGNPLNIFTKRIIDMRIAEGKKYYDELFLILDSLFKLISKKQTITWGSWVPSRNKILLKVAYNLLLRNNINIVKPDAIIKTDYHLDRISDKRNYVLDKYQLRKIYNPQTSQIIENKSGIIIDDIMHTSHTLGRIFEIFNNFNPKCLIGLIFSRTGKGKHNLYLKYPNIPENKK